MKTRCTKIAEHAYEVYGQNGPRKPWVLLGVVQRYGRLPSMQSWRALLVNNHKWSPSRGTRKDAIKDLVNRA
jgi:hypothetical protein